MADTHRLPLPIVGNWDWQASAACRGMDSEVFFHPSMERARGRRKRITAAKAVCRTCPVVRQCLDHALETREPYGIWGGRSEDERADMLGLRSLRYPAERSERAGRPAPDPVELTPLRPCPARTDDAGASEPIDSLHSRHSR